MRNDFIYYCSKRIFIGDKDNSYIKERYKTPDYTIIIDGTANAGC